MPSSSTVPSAPAPPSAAPAGGGGGDAGGTTRPACAAAAPSGAYHARGRFDPLLILSQIVALQATFYTSYLLLLLLFQRATGTRVALSSQIFDASHLTLSHFPGWVSALALVISAMGPTPMVFACLVGRSRRALDFATTLFASHLLAVWRHAGFPTTLVWWVLTLFAAAGLASVAEALSLRVELRAIPVPSVSTAPPPPSSASSGAPPLPAEPAMMQSSHAATHHHPNRLSKRAGAAAAPAADVEAPLPPPRHDHSSDAADTTDHPLIGSSHP